MSSLSCDTLSLAVDIEHEVFKSSKSSNLYKATVLKKVTTDCSACHVGRRCIPELISCLKVSEMKKAAPRGERGESGKTNSSSESRETESQLKEEASSSSSSSFSEELHGFTSASEIYSVRYILLHTCTFGFLLLQTFQI